MSRAIVVTGGSVQLQLSIAGKPYSVDVWKEGDGWSWTVFNRRGPSGRVGWGVRARWSEARTAAFRTCVRHAKAKLTSTNERG